LGQTTRGKEEVKEKKDRTQNGEKKIKKDQETTV